VILTSAALFLFAAFFLFLMPLAKEMGKKQATQAPTTEHAASNQLADNLLLVSPALHFVIWTKGCFLVQ
jgi:hypothetical protein